MEFGAIILAGGGSTRMGKDKGLLLFKGKAMVQYSIDAAVAAKQILLSSSNSEYDKFGFQRIEDVYDSVGPLGGIYSCLLQSKYEWNLVLSTDIPLIGSEIIEKLKPKNRSSQIVVIRCADQVHPLIGFYSKEIIPQLKAFLESGNRKVRHFMACVKTDYVDIDESFSSQLNNINTPQELSDIS